MKILPPALIACACVFTPVQAQTIHKCTLDGKVTYTETPCQAGSASVLEVPAAPAADPGAAKELKRMQKESKVMEKDRLRHQAAQDRADERTNRANAAHQQKCAKLNLDKKWADEDLKGAQPQQEERARLKAQRAAEKLKLACPA
ncbi:MAG: DUF4124 domain-containing protein [Pseudomonadota bacterium]